MAWPDAHLLMQANKTAFKGKVQRSQIIVCYFTNIATVVRTVNEVFEFPPYNLCQRITNESASKI